MPWYEWADLGGSIKESPAVASWGPGRLDAFGLDRSTDSIAHSYYEGGYWSAWEGLGGPFASAPAAVSSGPNLIDVVARGRDNQVYLRSFAGGSWTDWTSLGGSFRRARWTPAIASAGRQHGEVFGLGDDGALLHKAWDARTGWSDWESLGGTFLAGPWAAGTPGGLLVMVADTNSRVWSKQWMDGRWSEWVGVEDMPVPVALASSWQWEPRNGLEITASRFDTFVLQADGNLWHKVVMDPGDVESDWENLGGPLVGAGAASWAPNRLDVLATGQNDRVYHKAWMAG